MSVENEARPITVRDAQPDDLADVALMMREYSEWLGIDLTFQGFDREAAHLPGDYAPPRGALLVAWRGDRRVGMAALRRLDGSRGEMKRLFVRPSARGAGVGRLLAEGVIRAVRRCGYRRLVLDTLPVMHAAHALYERMGFAPIAPYYESPIAGTRYLGLDVTQE